MDDMKSKAINEAGILAALQERVKELDCLYQIGDIAQQPDLETREILSRIISIIPAAMQYPHLAGARLMLDGNAISSHTVVQGPVQISADIFVNYINRGILEVFYQSESDGSLPSFLPEEERLLNTIAKQISLVIERRSVEEYNSKLQEQLRHADRLATIGQLAAGIAHEINEPLATIMGYAQLIDEEEDISQQVKQDTGRIISAALHAREVIRKLMLFSRQVPPNKVELNLNKVITDGFYFLESRCERQSIEIEKDLDPANPTIVADASQIHQVMVNLVVNAMHAMPEGGKLTLRTKQLKDSVLFSVADTGTGMTDEIKSKVFIPFYTTKDINQGTGLGLSVVHGIISSHNGKIEVDSKLGKGSIFNIYFEVRHA
ncbi:MAG: PAS domain-containing sensor histidine kinase [Candidatus Cloacimonetes bacterium HGW-Cloacimonetes-2]|jgi:signal transduction histidine kinase|nr:MAG: PAS domain-containing sensor histidine kinase [Candidatus Cloacimonetes bacterium HGW-Cloacimonetes-2]